MFPNSIGAGKYDLVKIYNYPYITALADILNKHTFIFETLINTKNGIKYALIRREIVPDKILTVSNQHVKEAKKHDYDGTPLKVNDYLTITENKNGKIRDWIAEMKDYPVYDQDGGVVKKEDATILLFSDSNRYNNLHEHGLSAEFDFYLKFQQQCDKLKKLKKDKYKLEKIANKTKTINDLSIIKIIKYYEKQIEKETTINDFLMSKYHKFINKTH